MGGGEGPKRGSWDGGRSDSWDEGRSDRWEGGGIWGERIRGHSVEGAQRSGDFMPFTSALDDQDVRVFRISAVNDLISTSRASTSGRQGDVRREAVC